jgi:hypothetical protein
MPRLTSVRRLGLTLAGLVGAGAVCVACASSTGGEPHTVSSAAGGFPSDSASVSVPSTSVSVPTLPSVSVSVPDGLPSGGSSGAAFCKEFNLNDLSKLGSTSDYQQVIATWDKLTADAPADVKPDFQKVDDYLHSIVSGHPNGTNNADLTTAGEDIGRWYVANCSG